MSDRRFQLDAVRPLVSQCNPTGRHLVVTFTCPVSGRHVNARWSAPQGSEIGSRVVASAKQSMWYELRRTAHSMVSAALGHGMAGRLASQTMDAAMMGAAPGYGSHASRGLSSREIDQGVVEAFRSVSAQFVWVDGRWLHASAARQRLAPFDQQLQDHPLTGRYDRLVGARMMVEIAGAHGGISEEERSHLEETLDPELGSLQALAQRPPLTRAELAETSPGGARVTLLAMAWMLALCDESFAEEERARLEQLALGLGLRGPEGVRARDLARGWLLEQAFERAFSWGGHDAHAREAVVELGARLGMSREEVEVAEAQYQRRRS